MKGSIQILDIEWVCFSARNTVVQSMIIWNTCTSNILLLISKAYVLYIMKKQIRLDNIKVQ